MKLCVTFIAAVLMVLQLSAQVVQGQDEREMVPPDNKTMATTPKPSVNVTMEKSGCGTSGPFMLLLPLALGVPLLHSWS